MAIPPTPSLRLLSAGAGGGAGAGAGASAGVAWTWTEIAARERNRAPPHPQLPSQTPRGTLNPTRHPGERRDPWTRRTRRYRAAITRSATMGPGVRRDDGEGVGTEGIGGGERRPRWWGVKAEIAACNPTALRPTRNHPPIPRERPSTPSVIPANAGTHGHGGPGDTVLPLPGPQPQAPTSPGMTGAGEPHPPDQNQSLAKPP